MAEKDVEEVEIVVEDSGGKLSELPLGQALPATVRNYEIMDVQFTNRETGEKEPAKSARMIFDLEDYEDRWVSGMAALRKREKEDGTVYYSISPGVTGNVSKLYTWYCELAGRPESGESIKLAKIVGKPCYVYLKKSGIYYNVIDVRGRKATDKKEVEKPKIEDLSLPETETVAIGDDDIL